MDFERDFADPKLETSGVWVDYVHNGVPVEGARVKIGRLGNPEWQAKYDKLMQPFRALERDGRMPSTKHRDILCQSYVGTVLMDWEGFTRNGKAYKYSEEAAYRMLREKVDFRNSVTVLAGREESFHKEYEEESVKNSGSASAGSSNTAESA